MMTTVFLLGLFYAILVTVLFLFVKSLAIIIIIPVALIFAQYYASDKIALWSMHAKIVTEEQAPQLHAIIDRLCALGGHAEAEGCDRRRQHAECLRDGAQPVPRSRVRDDGDPSPRLSEPELEAVLAHELSHVAHRDVAVMTIASFLGVIAGFVTRMLLWSDMFGGLGGGRGRSNNNQGGGQLILFELGALAFAAVFYFLSFLLIRALSRYRELAADRSGAILIGQPGLLASALQKVTGDISRIPTRDLRSAQNFNAFFFAPASSKGLSLATLFATHPPLQVRLDQLAKLEAQMSKTA